MVIILASVSVTFNFLANIKNATSMASPSFLPSSILASLLIPPKNANPAISFLEDVSSFSSPTIPLSSTMYSRSSGNMIFLAVCSLIVRVPVLSEAITVQLPRDSAAFSFLTITFFFAILFEAIVSAIVSARGSPSGIADTASAITLKKISS